MEPTEYKYQDLVKKMARMVYTGYSYKDAYVLLLDDYYANTKLFITSKDWQIIYGKAADLVAKVIVQKEKEGLLHRRKKFLTAAQLKNPILLKNRAIPIYGDIYSKPMLLHERMELSFKSLHYKHKNLTQVLQLMVKKYSIDLGDENSKPLQVLKRLIKEAKE